MYSAAQLRNVVEGKREQQFFLVAKNCIVANRVQYGWWMTTYTHDGISPTAAPLRNVSSMNKTQDEREGDKKKNAWTNLKFKFLIKFLSSIPPSATSPAFPVWLLIGIIVYHEQWSEPLFIVLMQMKVVEKQTTSLAICDYKESLRCALLRHGSSTTPHSCLCLSCKCNCECISGSLHSAHSCTDTNLRK